MYGRIKQTLTNITSIFSSNSITFQQCQTVALKPNDCLPLQIQPSKSTILSEQCVVLAI